MIYVQDLHKTFYYAFHHRDVLRNISFTMEAGESMGIIGQNGAGKTTLMKLLLGFLFPTRGEVKVLDVSPQHVKTKARIGFLPEQCLLYRYLTGKEFLVLCAELSGVSVADCLRVAYTLAERLELAPALTQRVGTYSKGMQQRLGLIQALMHRPEVILLDEPMSGLDPLGRALFVEILQEERARGTTIILNSHILSDLERLCHRVIVLHHGEVVGEKDLSDLPSTHTLEDYFIETIRSYEPSGRT